MSHRLNLQRVMKDNIDLGLLPLLVDLAKYRNLTRVARKHGKTTSAVSKQLSKLKEMLDDELFINTTSGLQPTAYVESMIGNLEDGLRQVGESINKTVFDPVTYDNRIVVAANAVIIELYGVEIYNAIKSAMPNIRFTLMTWDESSLTALEKNEVNIGIHLSVPDLNKNIHIRHLAEDRVVLAMRKDHPATDFRTAIQYPVVVIKSKGWNDLRYYVVDHLTRAGYQVRLDVEMDQQSTINRLLLVSDCTSLTASTSINEDFKYFELPLENTFYVSVSFYCKAAHRHTPINQLLYRLVKQVINARANRQANVR